MTVTSYIRSSFTVPLSLGADEGGYYKRSDALRVHDQCIGAV